MAVLTMTNIRLLLVFLLTTQLFEFSITQECDNESDSDIPFPRIIVMMEKGDGKLVGSTAELAARALGGCRTPEEHADIVIDFYEKKYNVDLTPVRKAPYEKYENEIYIYTPIYSNPDADHRITVSTFYEYAKATDIPFTIATFSLEAKEQIRGPEYTIPPGSFGYYGLARWEEDGRENCLDYFERTPVTFSTSFTVPADTYGALDFECYHNIWGKCTIPGFVSFSNGTLDSVFIIQMPGVN